MGEGLGAGFPPDARRDTLEKGYTPVVSDRLLEISRGLVVSGGERLLTCGIVDERRNSNAGAARWPLLAGGNPDLAGRVVVCYRHRPRMLGSVRTSGTPALAHGCGPLVAARMEFYEHFRGTAAQGGNPGLTSCPE